MEKRYCFIVFVLLLLSVCIYAGCEGIAFNLTEEANSTLKIFAIGGDDGTNSLSTVDCFNAKMKSWASMSDMPTERLGLAAAEVDGMIYAIGGSEKIGGTLTTTLSKVEMYNPSTDIWSTKAAMPTARVLFAAVEVDGMIYSIGGVVFTGGVVTGILPTVEMYNPAVNGWSVKAFMPTPNADFAAVEVDGMIYVIGGGLVPHTIVGKYNPSTDTWSTKASMPTGRQGLAAVVVDGMIYAIGGNDGTNIFSTVEMYNPSTDIWSTRASMSTARRCLAAVAVDGMIYAVGGDDGTNRLSSIEVYNPSTNKWSTTDAMPTAKSEFAAVVIKALDR